jgi:hypothetical protein
MCAIAIAATPAHAGTYTVHSCRTAAGAAAGVGDWIGNARRPELSRSASACPDGPYSLELLPAAQHPPDSYVARAWRAPADTVISSYRLWRSAQLARPYNYRLYEMTPHGLVEGDVCISVDGCLVRGNPGDPLGAGNLVGAENRADVTGLEVLLTCGEVDTGPTHCPATAPAARFQLHRADITLLDRTPPQITSVGGELVEPGVEAIGLQSLSVGATDRGGGVYRAEAEVDGAIVSETVLDPNGGACAEPFVVAQACKRSASGTLGVDTARLADGDHSLRVRVSDATRTNVTEWGPVRIRTANAGCAPTPRVDALRMRASLAPRGRRAPGRRSSDARDSRALGGRSSAARDSRAPAGRSSGARGRARVRGRLLTPAGVPVGGARICVAARAAMTGAALRSRGWVTTRADGRFSYRLRRGPSRRVYLIHRTAGGAVVASVRVRVRANVSMRASRGELRTGQRVVLRGRLRGRPIPRRGVLVELQAKRGRRWQTFGTARTNRRGRYRFSYPFTRTAGVQYYTLRARVPRQASYPYARGASRPEIVVVRG